MVLTARFGRQCEGRVDIEIIAIGGIGFDTEEIFYFLLHIGEIGPVGYVFRIIAVTDDYDIDAAVVALRSSLQGEIFVFAVLVAILRHMATVCIVFVFEAEHDIAFARLCGRRGFYGKCDFALLAARCLRQFAPAGYRLDLPVAFGIYDERLFVLCAKSAGNRRTAYKLMMCGNALEIAPAGSGCILGDR